MLFLTLGVNRFAYCFGVYVWIKNHRKHSTHKWVTAGLQECEGKGYKVKIPKYVIRRVDQVKIMIETS